MADSIQFPNNRDFRLPKVVQGPAKGEIPTTHLQRNERLRGVIEQAEPRPFTSPRMNDLNEHLRDKSKRSFEAYTKTPDQTRFSSLDRKVVDRVAVGNDLRPTRLPYVRAEPNPQTGGDAFDRTSNHLTHRVQTDAYFRTYRDSENMISREPTNVQLPPPPKETVVDYTRVEDDLRPNYLLRRTEVIPPDCKASAYPGPLLHDTSLAMHQNKRVGRENTLRKPEHSEGMDIRDDGRPYEKRKGPYETTAFDHNLVQQVNTDSQFRKMNTRDSRLPYQRGITCDAASPLIPEPETELIHPQTERAKVEETFRPKVMKSGAPSGIPANHAGGYAHLVSEKVNSENVLRPLHVPFQKQYNAPLEKYEIRSYTNFGDSAPEPNEDDTILARVDNGSALRWKYTDKPSRKIIENIPLRYDEFPNQSIPRPDYGTQEHPAYQVKTKYATMEKKYPSEDILSIDPVDPSMAHSMKFQQKPGRLISEKQTSRQDLFPTKNPPLAPAEAVSLPGYEGPARRSPLNEKAWGRPDVFPTSGVPLASYGTDNRDTIASRPAGQVVHETCVDRYEPFPTNHVPLSNVGTFSHPKSSQVYDTM